MFFCEPCRVKNEWPESTLKSFGRCEECGHKTRCHDVPSMPSREPKPKKERKKKETPTPKFMLITHTLETNIETAFKRLGGQLA
jgi:predicted ATP-dependent serine protease